MNGEILVWLPVPFFLAVAIFTAMRTRGVTDVHLPIGLTLVTVSAALRTAVFTEAIRRAAGSPVDEVVKHIALVVGCLLISAWLAQALDGRAVRRRQIFGGCVGTAALMVFTFSASGPWSVENINAQTAGRPMMVLYWGVFYGCFLWASGLFAYAALRSRSSEQMPRSWGMVCVATGAAIGVLWAVLAISELIARTRGLPSDERFNVLGLEPRVLLAATGILLSVGIIGHLAAANSVSKRERASLRYLHECITEKVPAIVSSPATTGAVASYHRRIQILDGMGTLSHYSTPADRAAIARDYPEASQETVVAHQMQMALDRLSAGESRSESPAIWSDFLADDSALRRLGAALRQIV
ncbi:DUF6545 domain-containing protein [Myceligenerans crystallogenes]|uniref:DUF6545 domain-containing protein n=1 Tax=Myceligenerans crystallogenes TaxID=316335 RepID=A0ABP4ZBP5_9MICO